MQSHPLTGLVKSAAMVDDISVGIHSQRMRCRGMLRFEEEGLSKEQSFFLTCAPVKMSRLSFCVEEIGAESILYVQMKIVRKV